MHCGAARRTIVIGLGLAFVISSCGRATENLVSSPGSNATEPLGVSDVESSITEIDGATDPAFGETNSGYTEKSADLVGLNPTATIQFLDNRDGDFATTDFDSLSPNLADLGPGWDQFQATVFDSLPVSDPVTGAQDPRCGIDTFLHNGVLIDYGFGGALGDAGLLVSRGTAAQNRQTYEALVTTFACPANEADNGVAYTLASNPPALPGSIASVRFQINDALGRQSEGILILRPDLVMMLDVSSLIDRLPVGGTSPPPADVTALAAKLLTDYDASGIATVAAAGTEPVTDTQPTVGAAG